MEENKRRYDLVSAGFGAFAGAATLVVAGAGSSIGSVGGAFVGAFGGGFFIDALLKPRNFVIGGIASLVTYVGLSLASADSYSRGIERLVSPFSAGGDQGIVIQRGDGSQIPYLLLDGKYVLFDDESNKSLDSKIAEGQKIVDGLKENYDARRNAILESIKNAQK